MPFDGSNYGSEVLRLLRRARDRIANGQWVKGSLVRRGLAGQSYFCLVGSITCDDTGQDMSTKDTYDALMHLSKVVPRIDKDVGRGPTRIVRFNDDKNTTHEQVKDVLDTAVRLQELEEFGTSIPAK